MPSRPRVLLFACPFIFAALAVACQPAPTGPGQPGGQTAGRDPGDTGDAAASATRDAERSDRRAAEGPIAYVGGRPIQREELIAPLLEAAGGEVLAELVLDRQIAERLAERGQTLSEAEVAAERERVGTALSDDEDEASRLLEELRRQRGLGEQRFEAFLRRNAGLRKLVAERVEIDDDTLRQAYRVRYGERYRVRVLVVDSFDEASRLRRQIVDHEASFSDLAARHSTDISADRGGLLSPISPADASYPEGIREALPRLARQADGREGEGGRVSEVIALDGQFALVRLEEKIEPEPVEFADVRNRLEAEVRRQLERGHMRQLARELLGEVNVTVLDPALGRSWRQQRGRLLTP